MLAFGTGKPGIPWGGFTGRFTLAGRVLNRRQQTPALGKVFLTNPVGQQPVVPNAHESFWKAVQKEPPDELGGIHAHEPLAMAATVIFITKGNLPVGQANQPPVGYSHPVGIPGQVLCTCLAP